MKSTDRKLTRKTSGNALEHEIHELYWPPMQLLKDRPVGTPRTNLADYIKDDPKNGNQSDDWGFVFSEAEYGNCDRSTQEKLVKHIQASCAEQGFSMTVHTWANKGEERGTLRVRLKCSHNRRTKCKFSFQLCFGLTEGFWYLRRGSGNHVHSGHVLEKPRYDGALKRATSSSKSRKKESAEERSLSPAPQGTKKPKIELSAASGPLGGAVESAYTGAMAPGPTGYPPGPYSPYSRQAHFAYPPAPSQEEKMASPPSPSRFPADRASLSSASSERRNKFLKSQGQAAIGHTAFHVDPHAKPLNNASSLSPHGAYPHHFNTGTQPPLPDLSRPLPDTSHQTAPTSTSSGVLGEIPAPKALHQQPKNQFSSSCNFLLASSASLQRAMGELPEILASTTSLPRPEEEETKSSPGSGGREPSRPGGGMSPRLNRAPSPPPPRHTASPQPNHPNSPRNNGKRSPMYPPATIDTRQKGGGTGYQGLPEHSAPPSPRRGGGGGGNNGKGAASGDGLLPDHTAAPPRPQHHMMKSKDRGTSRAHSTFFSSIDTFAFSSAGSLNDSAEDINKLEGFGGGTPAKKEEHSDGDTKRENKAVGV